MSKATSAAPRPVDLHYTGDGTRYLDGVPARDFSTADPQLVAICLESGLYTTTAPVAESPAADAPKELS